MHDVAMTRSHPRYVCRKSSNSQNLTCIRKNLKFHTYENITNQSEWIEDRTQSPVIIVPDLRK